MFKNKPEKRFFAAAAAGDLAMLAACLKNEVGKGDYSVDARNGSGDTALALAAEAGQAAAVKELLRNGANADIVNDKNSYPLLAAAEGARTEIVKLLAAAGANPNCHNNDFCGPLHWAAYKGDIESAKALIAAKADIDMTVSSNLYTPLHYALESNRVLVAETLIKAGARTDLKNKSGATALDLAHKTAPNLAELMEAVQKEPPALSAAGKTEPPAPAAAENGDTWTLLSPSKIAHVGLYPQINRRLTEIFNFESRERLILSENLSTGGETVSAAEKFDSLSPEAVATAADALRQRGGNPDRPLKVAFSL